MARHNREGHGSDQQGFGYTVSYQPDWLRQVKVTRLLDSGRQSTKTLFVNPTEPARKPGRLVRTEVRSEAQDLRFAIAITDPGRVVRRVIVETGPAESSAHAMGEGDVFFTFDDGGRP
ncbi:MAG TPA: hypothetical protein VMM12_19005 [Longimicrobiales bacterium]|nr:hypothetical protein [Longimicrobiales bacterium]